MTEWLALLTQSLSDWLSDTGLSDWLVTARDGVTESIQLENTLLDFYCFRCKHIQSVHRKDRRSPKTHLLRYLDMVWIWRSCWPVGDSNRKQHTTATTSRKWLYRKSKDRSEAVTWLVKMADILWVEVSVFKTYIPLFTFHTAMAVYFTV